MSAQHVAGPQEMGGSGGSQKVKTTWRWIAAVFAIAILLQAVLASFGFFESEPGLVDIHRELGNLLPLLALGQAMLAIILFRRGAIGKAGMWTGVALVPVVLAQLSMGYETSDSATATALHISLGVLLMSLTTVNAMLAWMPGRRG